MKLAIIKITTNGSIPKTVHNAKSLLGCEFIMYLNQVSIKPNCLEVEYSSFLKVISKNYDCLTIFLIIFAYSY